MEPINEPGSAPALLGSRCPACGNVAFPVAVTCQRCGGRGAEALPLSRRGAVWGHTVQRFPPKSPPYVPPAEGFVPFAVGYVQLPEGVRVEAVLDHAESEDLSDAEVTLVAVEPVPRFATDRALGGAA